MYAESERGRRPAQGRRKTFWKIHAVQAPIGKPAYGARDANATEGLSRQTRAVAAPAERDNGRVLTDRRAKPAVPFAGKYRIIDFTLSNCVNSGIFDLMILTQYRPHSLIEHIGAGRPWDLDRGFTGGVHVYQPYRGRLDTDWYESRESTRTLVSRARHPDRVLVWPDHIYKMNYGSLIAYPQAAGRDDRNDHGTPKRTDGIIAVDDDHALPVRRNPRPPRNHRIDGI